MVRIVIRNNNCNQRHSNAFRMRKQQGEITNHQQETTNHQREISKQRQISK